MQQGRFVADALVMLDEGAPCYGGWREELSIPLPAGYDYDFANFAALRESRVERGGNLAEVIVNDHNQGVVWKRPARLDVTSALQDGDNILEILVTNLWANRLIGDAKRMAALSVAYNNRNGVISKWPDWMPQDAPPDGAPVSFATWRQWQGDEVLLPSGLLGPVWLRPTSLQTARP